MCLTTFRITYSCDYRSAQFINCWRIFTSLFFEVSTHRKSEISVAKVVFVNEWVCVRVSHLFVRSIFFFNVHGVIHWLVVTRSLALSMLFILISTSVFIIHSVFFCLFFHFQFIALKTRNNFHSQFFFFGSAIFCHRPAVRVFSSLSLLCQSFLFSVLCFTLARFFPVILLLAVCCVDFAMRRRWLSRRVCVSISVCHWLF